MVWGAARRPVFYFALIPHKLYEEREEGGHMPDLMSLSELSRKEVINLCDGARLGFICDAEFNLSCGQITAFIIPGRLKFFGLLGREDDIVLLWGCIKKIGEDVILVEQQPNYRKKKINHFK